jgi:alkylation response protein AidB-like acyl-CoA dehydrogenase
VVSSVAASDVTAASEHELALVDRRVDELLTAFPPRSTERTQFWGAQFDHGLAWVQFPQGAGGLGVAPQLQERVNGRLLDAGASLENSHLNIAGIGLMAGTLIEHGTPEQIERHLRPLFTTEEIWCQLFSEPGSGSDLASVSTSARRDGSSWIINGQKVWTSLGHLARWGMLVTRSNADLPKHRGITYFILDMQTPGVDVRPLFQITGEAEFNEVFLEDVRIDDAQRIGPVDGGWGVAVTTLMNERTFLANQRDERGGGAIATAVEVWARRASEDPRARDELTRLWIEAEMFRLTAKRARQNAVRGVPGPEGSIGKVHWASVNQAITSFAVGLLGHEGMTYPSGYPFSRPAEIALTSEDVHKAYLRSRANSIEGGTTEIMKTIIAERILGLPAEPKPDNDVAWRLVPRGPGGSR